MRFPIALLTVLVTVLACALAGVSSARSQISDDIVKIGVLNDQSGLYGDLGGPGSVIAARMAVEDAGGAVLGKPVEIAVADHQNKADIGAAIARNQNDAQKCRARASPYQERRRFTSFVAGIHVYHQT